MPVTYSPTRDSRSLRHRTAAITTVIFPGFCPVCFADILDPALLRPGRLDRKIEIPLPNETSRLDILKIHSAPITKRGEIDFESVVKVGQDKSRA